LFTLLGLFFFRAVGMEAQAVPEGLGFFDRFRDVVEFYADFEFTPAGFGDLEGLPVDGFDG
jgi:hypothetical protein